MLDALRNDLKTLISVSDLKQYMDNDALLNMAIEWAASEVNKRRGHSPAEGELVESKYRFNVLQGASDWLSRIGGEEYQSFSENGISANFKEIPSWLQSVIPKLGV